MNKEEILNEINKTKEHLANMEKILGEYEYERWEPKENEAYFYVSSNGKIARDKKHRDFIIDESRCNFYNCFRTKEQAEKDTKDYCKNCYVEPSAIKLKIKDNTHLVIKRKLINERLCKTDRELFYALLNMINKGSHNEYIICNKDEPYANKVLQAILQGEAKKQM